MPVHKKIQPAIRLVGAVLDAGPLIEVYSHLVRLACSVSKTCSSAQGLYRGIRSGCLGNGSTFVANCENGVGHPYVAFSGRLNDALSYTMKLLEMFEGEVLP